MFLLKSWIFSFKIDFKDIFANLCIISLQRRALRASKILKLLNKNSRSFQGKIARKIAQLGGDDSQSASFIATVIALRNRAREIRTRKRVSWTVRKAV